MSKKPYIVSLNVGQPKTVVMEEMEVTTGIYKQPVATPLWLTKTNFLGDGQADLIHHGGLDKAICAYPSEHFIAWERLYGRPFMAGSFGENTTLSGLLEEDVCVGDIFEVGTAVIQVSQPRQPCFKLAKRHGLNDLPLKVQETGYTGFYFRVLQEGSVQRGDSFTLIERSARPFSIRYINHIYYVEKTNKEAMSEIIAEPALSEDWRRSFLKRMEQ
ncbi:MOSC domain-containing protein [Anoxybacillus sp. J5B_2022]|uniref:MOSC domain-containing protein n=1 Tax=Anoxybacillus sp. J5B_2022 TaxID=3003246 RepID=UPI0022857D61|nr:MOSC domain-containing protein [Anoxybacillus sp. J5B_2022]MCZ0755902.1 MOSC domain-containing protein [Anoxybacillus sp. J5B_2022]